MQYIEDIDPKCLSCKFFMNAPALQIWCSKLGVDYDMPTKSCDKYRRGKITYVMVKYTTCPTCGHRLQESAKLTDKPKNAKKVKRCGLERKPTLRKDKVICAFRDMRIMTCQKCQHSKLHKPVYDAIFDDCTVPLTCVERNIKNCYCCKQIK